jgi:catechol 2,3-dioxygenase-like lactoylglutathione lyase family enzyme
MAPCQLHERLVLPLLGALLAAQAGTGAAQLSSPNASGVAMGHLHYVVKDVAANKRFWTQLGGKPVTVLDTIEGVLFPDVVVLLRQGEPSGGSEGSVVNHVAFRVQSLAAVEAAGLTLEHNEQYPGIASVFSPEGERIELFDESATNLGFAADGGTTNAIAERHNRPMEVPIIAHHVHLFVPEADVARAKEWYANAFGGVPGKRWRYEAVDLPGINLNFSGAAEPLAATRGRGLDHLGFEVQNLEAFCEKLEADGIVLDQPYRKLPSGFGLAFLTDPWGTYIELSEGLRDFDN